MYIHLMEMSPYPEKALRHGDRLSMLMPDAGHLLHMSTHIDVLCGDYMNVVLRNQTAIEADRRYLAHAGAENFYSVYRCHNYHFKIYGAMFLGQPGPALEAAEELIETLPDDLLRPLADWFEGFIPMKQHVLIRFGRWQEILDQPLPGDAGLYCVTTAMMRYARCSWTRGVTRRPRPSTAPIWGLTTRWPAPASTPTMSGAYTVCMNA